MNFPTYPKRSTGGGSSSSDFIREWDFMSKRLVGRVSRQINRFFPTIDFTNPGATVDYELSGALTGLQAPGFNGGVAQLATGAGANSVSYVRYKTNVTQQSSPEYVNDLLRMPPSFAAARMRPDTGFNAESQIAVGLISASSGNGINVGVHGPADTTHWVARAYNGAPLYTVSNKLVSVDDLVDVFMFFLGAKYLVLHGQVVDDKMEQIIVETQTLRVVSAGVRPQITVFNGPGGGVRTATIDSMIGGVGVAR